jgi:hypothetical protein
VITNDKKNDSEEPSVMLGKSKSGMSLVSVLIAMSIMGIAIMLTSTMIKNTLDVKKLVEINATRDSLAARIKSRIGNMETLNLSAQQVGSGNQALRDCLDIGSSPCSILDPGKQLSFNLYLTKNGASQKRLAGTQTDPQYYSISGAACPPGTPVGGSKQCKPAWSATAHFWATCQAGATSCKQASTLFLRYQVAPILNHYPWKKVPKAMPPEPEFSSQPASFAVSVAVAGDYVRSEGCMGVSIQVGVRPDGRPECACKKDAVMVGMDANGNPICVIAGKTCALPAKAVGVDKNGDIMCEVPQAPQVYCYSKKLGGGSSNSCRPTEWLNRARFGDCFTNKATKKDGLQAIRCNEDTGTCCGYR